MLTDTRNKTQHLEKLLFELKKARTNKIKRSMYHTAGSLFIDVVWDFRDYSLVLSEAGEPGILVLSVNGVCPYCVLNPPENGHLNSFPRAM